MPIKDVCRISLTKSLSVLRSARVRNEIGTWRGLPDVGTMMALHEYLLAMKMMIGP